MNALRKLIALLSLCLSSTTVFAVTVTDAQVFAYAEANYPSLFTGTATAGQYLQYNYRYYSASGNYLAVDTAGEIFVLGPYTGNVITSVGLATAYASYITAWEATQAGTGSTGDTAGGTTGSTGAGLVGTWILTSGTSTYTNTLGSDGVFTSVMNSPSGGCAGSPTTFTVSGNTYTAQSYSWTCNGYTTTVPQTTYTWSISGNQLTLIGQYTNVFTRQ